VRGSGRRAAIFGTVAAVLVTAFTLGVAELSLRLVDYPSSAFSPWIRSDAFGFRLAPGISLRMKGPEYDVEVATNSLGMRDDEPVPKKGRRVLLLGDSFAMGYGVERGRLFADLLEKQLEVDVVNAGTGGYEIVQQPRVLAEHGPQLKPDLVVYALYLGNDLAQNDEWEVRQDGALQSRVRQYPVRQPREAKLWRLVRDFLYGVRQGRSEKEGEWLPFEGYLGLCEKSLGEEARKDYDDADRHLAALAKEAGSQGARLLVLTLPYRSMVEPEALASLARKVPGLAERYDLTRPALEIGARMDARGIDHADVTPFLVEEYRKSGRPLFYPVDGHLTDAGHEAVARFVAPLVRERLAAGPDL
jgi:lysophospholipase L1-like esterase